MRGLGDGLRLLERLLGRLRTRTEREAAFPEVEALRAEHRRSDSDGGRRVTATERDRQLQARADTLRTLPLPTEE